MGKVRFANSQYFDTDESMVLFTAFYDRALIRCAVGIDTLRDCFHDSAASPVASFVRHRHQIEHCAERLIVEGRLEADASVMIHAADLNWLREAHRWPIGAQASSPA